MSRIVLAIVIAGTVALVVACTLIALALFVLRPPDDEPDWARVPMAQAEAAVRGSPQDAWAREVLAMKLMDQGRFVEAASQFEAQERLGLDNESGDTDSYIAQCYEACGKLQTAEHYWRLACRKEPAGSYFSHQARWGVARCQGDSARPAVR